MLSFKHDVHSNMKFAICSMTSNCVSVKQRLNESADDSEFALGWQSDFVCDWDDLWWPLTSGHHFLSAPYSAGAMSEFVPAFPATPLLNLTRGNSLPHGFSTIYSASVLSMHFSPPLLLLPSSSHPSFFFLFLHILILQGFQIRLSPKESKWL